MDLLALVLMVAAALGFFVAFVDVRLTRLVPLSLCLLTVGIICQGLHPTTLVG